MRNSDFESITGRKLPRNVEARPMRRGGHSFRLILPDKTRVNLGWNYDEAMARVRELSVSKEDAEADALAKEICARHRKGAKARGIAFALDPAHIRDLLVVQKFRCAVTGRRFSREKLPGVRARPYAPSLDRIRSSEPYVPGNCRLVCAAVNAALADMGDEVFRSLFEPMVRQIVQDEMAKIMGTASRKAA
jgi:hypothetical protein